MRLPRSRTVAPPPPAAAPAPERTAALVEGELAAARARHEDAGDVLASAEAAYSAALDLGRDEALDVQRRVREAMVDRDIAARAVERIEAELAPLLQGARTAAEAAERAALIADAEEKAARYAEAFTEHYPEIVARSRLLIRLQAEADLAREAAVQTGAPLPPADTFRGLPGRERQVLDRRTVHLWRNPHGGVFADKLQAQIKVQADGRGMLPGERPIYATQKQPHEVVTYLPGRSARVAASLATGLSLPSPAFGHPVGWAPLLRADPRAILKELDRLERLPPADDTPPEPKTSQTPIGPPIDVVPQPERRT